MLGVIADVAERGFGFGLLLTTFWLGFRHGIDYDHIAAITDITSSQDERRRSLLFGTLYALGHAVVVFTIGVLAIVAGENLPEGVDEVMTRIVGVTLLILGVYVVYSLIRHGRDFRLRSRWMLVFEGVRRGARWAKARAVRRREEVPAPQARAGSAAARVATLTREDGEPEAALWHHGHHGLPGHHHHQAPERDDTFMNYGRATAFFVGMIHGVGGETPTQVVIFATAAGVTSAVGGIGILAAFLIGLFTSNSLITLGSAFGFMSATRNFALYATVAIMTAAFSLVIGTIFLFGETAVLPALFGG